MKTEAQILRATPGSPDVTFTFSNTVDQFLTGITQLYFTYGSSDHHVRTVTAGMSPSNSGVNVNVPVTMVLNDDSGHNISGSSYLDVGCIAATGQNTNSSVQLTSALPFQSGGTSSAISLQNNTFLNEPIMAGFDLSYGSDDHHVRRIFAKTAVSLQQGSTAAITGSDNMYDDSGNSATTKTLEGSYLGTYINGADSGIVAVEQSFATGAPATSIDLSGQTGGKPLTGAAVYLKSFDLSYEDDHHVEFIRAGASNVAFDGTTITFTPWAQMEDDGGRKASGSITLIIVGTVDA